MHQHALPFADRAEKVDGAQGGIRRSDEGDPCARIPRRDRPEGGALQFALRRAVHRFKLHKHVHPFDAFGIPRERVAHAQPEFFDHVFGNDRIVLPRLAAFRAQVSSAVARFEHAADERIAVPELPRLFPGIAEIILRNGRFAEIVIAFRVAFGDQFAHPRNALFRRVLRLNARALLRPQPCGHVAARHADEAHDQIVLPPVRRLLHAERARQIAHFKDAERVKIVVDGLVQPEQFFIRHLFTSRTTVFPSASGQGRDSFRIRTQFSAPMRFKNASGGAIPSVPPGR